MTTVNEIYSMLESVAKGIKSANAAVAKAQDAKAGSYNGAVAVALQATNADQLEKAFDKLFANIRTDGRLAVAVGAPKSKSKKAIKAGEKYTIPTGLQSAKSVLLGAIRLGVSLTGDEGDPKSFNQIRKDKKEEEDRIAAENASPDDKLRAEAREVCEGIVSGLSEWGAHGLAEMVDSLRQLRDEVTQANADVQAEADADAEAIAEAA